MLKTPSRCGLDPCAAESIAAYITHIHHTQLSPGIDNFHQNGFFLPCPKKLVNA